jgi:hypothetical protein
LNACSGGPRSADCSRDSLVAARAGVSGGPEVIVAIKINCIVVQLRQGIYQLVEHNYNDKDPTYY